MSEKEQFDGNSIIKEIDAIVQNSGKAKKIINSITQHVEIDIDKDNSSLEAVCGTLSIITHKKFMDGSIEKEVFRQHQFAVDQKDGFTLEKYDLDYPISKKIIKQIKDHIIGIMSLANDEPISFKIDEPNVIHCKEPKILVICENGYNKDVKETVEHLMFTGQVNHHVNIGPWLNSSRYRTKGEQWAYLEVERLIQRDDSVVVTKNFHHWYEMMPLAVIAKMHRTDMIIGRNPGKRLALGDVLDINEVLEHFISTPVSLEEFYDDPYSSIKYFQNIDHTINSMVIFPSILHQFFAR